VKVPSISVKTDDMELRALRAIAADPKTPTHLRLGALNSLQRIKESVEPEPTGDPEEKMQALVDRLCPQEPELRDAPADPMRHLDVSAVSGGSVEAFDPFVWTWLPYCPSDPKAAERAILTAARRLGLGEGPYEVPGDKADELAQRRRRRRTG
jgi:hypothetical protein